MFYNKVQVFNRDISVMVMGLFAQWRYVERRERRAAAQARKAGGDHAAGKAAAAEEKARLYALSARELDALLRESEATDGIRVLDALAAIRAGTEIRGAFKMPWRRRGCIVRGRVAATPRLPPG